MRLFSKLNRLPHHSNPPKKQNLRSGIIGFYQVITFSYEKNFAGLRVGAYCNTPLRELISCFVKSQVESRNLIML